MIKALKRMPVSLAVLLMVLMMLAGLVWGNQNALRGASASAWDALDGVRVRVAHLSDKAHNYLTIASRLKLNGPLYDAVAQAQADVAKMNQGAVASMGASAAEIIAARADALENAVLALDKEIKAYAAALEEGPQKRLEQETRDSAYGDWCNTIQIYYEQMEQYNLQALYAQEFYDRLPARALLSNQLPPLFR